MVSVLYVHMYVALRAKFIYSFTQLPKQCYNTGFPLGLNPFYNFKKKEEETHRQNVYPIISAPLYFLSSVQSSVLISIRLTVSI